MTQLRSVITLARPVPIHYWFLIASLGAGVLLGGVLLLFGGIIALAVPLGLILIYMLFKTPEYVIIILLLFTSGILPANANPYVNLGIGHFQFSDLVLSSLLGITLVRAMAEHGFKLRATPLNLPLLLFCISVFIGIGTAVARHGIRFSHTTYEARILLTYSLFFAVFNLVRTSQQIRRVTSGIFVIGVLVALVILTRILFGTSILLLSSSHFKPDLLIRAYHPGFFATYMSSIVLVCLLAFLASRTAYHWKIIIWIILVILGSSLMVSLGRNIVVSTVLSMILLFFLLHSPYRERLIMNVFIFGLLTIILFGLISWFAPTSRLLAYPQALMDRFAHLFTTNIMSDDETLLWRIKETRFAWEQISQSPILGIGLRTPYRAEFFKGDELLSYIHNGYLWLWLKTGLLGLTAFLWFLLAFLWRGVQEWRQVKHEFMRSATLGFTLVVLAMLFSNFVAPVFVEGFNLAFFAAAIGIVESTFALERGHE